MVVKTTRKSKKTTAVETAAPVAAAPSVPEREYTFHESISGWEDARVGYARQQAAKAAAAAALRPKVQRRT